MKMDLNGEWTLLSTNGAGHCGGLKDVCAGPLTLSLSQEVELNSLRQWILDQWLASSKQQQM